MNRYCCDRKMQLLTSYRNGNELVVCRQCNRHEEISGSGYSIPQIDPRSAAERHADDFAAQTLETLADARPH